MNSRCLYDRIHAISQVMLDNAKQDNWSIVIEKQSERVLLLELDQNFNAEQLNKLIALDNELLRIVESQQDQVTEELQLFKQQKTASDQYKKFDFPG